MSGKVLQQSQPVYEFDASDSGFIYAWRDLKAAIANPRLMATFVINDFSRSNKGFWSGGFWVTFTTLATVSGLALIYSRVLGAPINTYFPYVASGIIFWGVITGLMNEGTGVFIAGATVFNQTPLPKALFVFRSTGKALIGLCFKLIVLLGVFIYVKVNLTVSGVLLTLLGFLLLLWICFWAALGLGVLGARFRDLGQLVAVSLTFAFFVTPVFWDASRLGDLQFIVEYNPLYHFLNVVRGPILGLPGVALSFVWTGIFAVLAFLFGWGVYGYFARRISYWC